MQLSRSQSSEVFLKTISILIFEELRPISISFFELILNILVALITLQLKKVQKRNV
jgi:hypothetical protein